MSEYSSLKATINANIKANNNHEITGAITNSVLNAMVDSLGAGYQFMGVATPTNPGSAQTPDYKCFYLATTPGTYTYLGGLVVADGEVALLKYDSSWTKEVTGVASADKLNQLGQEVENNHVSVSKNTDTGVPLAKVNIGLEEKLINGFDYETFNLLFGQSKTIVPIDYAKMLAIVSAYNDYAAQGTSSVIPVMGYNKIAITAIDASVVSFVKSIPSLSPTEGTRVIFATGETGRHSMSAGVNEFAIPYDALYAIVSRTNSQGAETSPSSVTLYSDMAVIEWADFDNLDSVIKSGIYRGYEHTSHTGEFLLVRKFNDEVLQRRMRISANLSGELYAVDEYRTSSNLGSTWSNWTNFSNGIVGFSDKFAYTAIDTITDSGIYRFDEPSSNYGVIILQVRNDADYNVISQVRYSISKAGDFTISFRKTARNQISWSEWQNWNPNPVVGFTDSFVYPNVDSLTTSGIYRVQEYSSGYGYPIIHVRKEGSLVTQVRYNINLSGAFTIDVRQSSDGGTNWGAWESFVDNAISEYMSKKISTEDYRTVSDFVKELLSCGAVMQEYGHGNVFMAYQADETNTEENEFLGTAISKASFFNILRPDDNTIIEIAKANQTYGGYAIGTYSPYDVGGMVLNNTTALVWFRLNGIQSASVKYGVCDVNLSTKVASNYRDMTLNGVTFNQDAIIAAYEELTGVTLTYQQCTPVLTGNVVKYNDRFYTFLGGSTHGTTGVEKAFSGMLLSSANGVDWVSEFAPDMTGLTTDKEIGEGVIAIDETHGYLYLCGRNFYNSAHSLCHGLYDLSDWSVVTALTDIDSGNVSSKPACAWNGGKLYLWAQASQDAAYNARRNHAKVYGVALPSLALTEAKDLVCADGIASPTLMTIGYETYVAFQTDARRIRPADQARSNIAFMNLL